MCGGGRQALRRRRLIAFTAGGTVVAAAFLTADLWTAGILDRFGRSGPQPDPNVVFVLPFANHTGEGSYYPIGLLASNEINEAIPRTPGLSLVGPDNASAARQPEPRPGALLELAAATITLMPRGPFAGSVRTKIRQTSATPPLVTKTLLALTT